MFANLIIDRSLQGYRFNEGESVAAFAVAEKVAGVVATLILAAKRLPAGFSGMVRLARA